MPACLPARLPACLPLPAYLPTYIHTYMESPASAGRKRRSRRPPLGKGAPIGATNHAARWIGVKKRASIIMIIINNTIITVVIHTPPLPFSPSCSFYGSSLRVCLRGLCWLGPSSQHSEGDHGRDGRQAASSVSDGEAGQDSTC